MKTSQPGIDSGAMDLSIVIVNWNSWDYLRNCIESIRENAGDLKYEIIVVDNCSSDNSVANITSNFPEVILIANKTNAGFPGANNQAFAVARGKYFLMLNPDTLVKKDALQRSLQVLERDATIGCIGVKTRKGNGEILFSCARALPTLWNKFWQLFYLDTIFKKWKFLKSPDMAYWDHNDSRDIDLLHGGYMMFPRTVYERLGGLDEKIPMFYEDVEYCCRIKKAGYRLYYLADAEIVNFVGVSCSKADPKWIANITQLLCETDYLYFLEYGGGRWAALAYVLLVLVTVPLRVLYSPVIWLGYLVKNRKSKKLALINMQILASAKWALRKLWPMAFTNLAVMS